MNGTIREGLSLYEVCIGAVLSIGTAGKRTGLLLSAGTTLSGCLRFDLE